MVFTLITIHFLFALPFLAQDTFKKTQYLLELFLKRLACPHYGYLDQDAFLHQKEVPILMYFSRAIFPPILNLNIFA